MKWYNWKLWRLAHSNSKQPHVLEGNNMWKRLAFGFWWRYDNTGSGTKD